MKPKAAKTSEAIERELALTFLATLRLLRAAANGVTDEALGGAFDEFEKHLLLKVNPHVGEKPAPVDPAPPPPIAPPPLVVAPVPAALSPGEKSEVLTTKELAARLQVTRRTLSIWKRRGILPYWKLGGVNRFDWDQVVKALNENNRVARRSCVLGR